MDRVRDVVFFFTSIAALFTLLCTAYQAFNEKFGSAIALAFVCVLNTLVASAMIYFGTDLRRCGPFVCPNDPVRVTPDHRGHGFAADSHHASARAPSPAPLEAAWRQSAGTDG
jgi:hypothetical protein